MIDIRDLGSPELTVDGGDPPRELLWRKNLALLVYLAHSADRRRTREHLTGMLWGRTGQAAARHSLNEAIRTLRRHGHADLILSDGEDVAIDTSLVRLDSERLDTAVADRRWEAVGDLIRGRFMEGFGVPDSNAFEDWLAAERMHWTQRCVDALVERAEACLRTGDLSGARDATGRALTLDPMSAASVRAVMKVTALAGERASALKLYEDYAGRVRQELGVDPDDETRKLADRIRRERTWRLPESLTPAVHDRGTLPLFGRELALADLSDAWRSTATSGGASLLVVEGESGSGRTRMLEELAARVRLEGGVVVGTRAVPADRDVPGAGLLGLCRGGLLEAPGLVVAPPQALAAVARHLPAWSERFADEIDGADPLEPGRALSEIVGTVAEEQPVLLAVDDARWCDTRSLRAIEALLRDLELRRVAVVMAVDDRPGPPELDRLRASVGRDLDGTTVRIAPLETADLRRMVEHEFPEYDDGELERMARRLEADSAGLPVLAAELLHGIRLGLDLDEGDAGWPETRRTLDQTRPGDLPDPVVAAIRTGFWALSPAARDVALSVAALGDRATEAELAEATGLEATRLAEALDELEWARWLTGEHRGYSFVAGIVREVLLEDMLPPGRTRRLGGT